MKVRLNPKPWMGLWGTVGELESQRVQLEQEVKNAEDALKTFKVHPQYRSIQLEADRITRELHDLVNQNVTKRRQLARFNESVTQENPPKLATLENIYRESGLVFPNAVCRTLSEANQFHERIIKNRRAFLETEIERLERDIEDREEQIKSLTETRASSLEILQTHGAIQELTKLQERNVELRGSLDRVRAKIQEIKELKTHKRDLQVSKTELAKIAEHDYDERQEGWSKAVLLFNDHSRALYNSPGKLVIDIGDSGYKYRVEIDRGGSEGIGKMKIFCFDLMLLQISQKESKRIDFLVHDSVIQDGVDSRQTALALERVSRITQDAGTQYICTLNSDMIPKSDFSSGFNYKKYVRLELTDRTQSGSLLGIKF